MDKKGIQTKLEQIQVLLTEVGQMIGQDQSDQFEPPDEVQDTHTQSVSEQTRTDGVDDEKKESAVGQIGVFDGEFVILESGKKLQVPPNYISKSRLVVGDKLKLTKEGEYNEFRIVEQVERVEQKGILTKKENQWIVLIKDPNEPTGGHEYRVVAAAIRYYEGEIGDQVEIVLPAQEQKYPIKWAAIKSIQQTADRPRREESPRPETHSPNEVATVVSSTSLGPSGVGVNPRRDQPDSDETPQPQPQTATHKRLTSELSAANPPSLAQPGQEIPLNVNQSPSSDENVILDDIPELR